MDPAFKIIQYGTPVYYEAVRLREAVLRAPLGLESELEQLTEESNDHYIHIIGRQREKDGSPASLSPVISTATLIVKEASCRMQGVAVSPLLRGVGIGSWMVQFCEKIAQKHSCRLISCKALEGSMRFYHKHGYQPEGEMMCDDGIVQYHKMTKILGGVDTSL